MKMNECKQLVATPCLLPAPFLYSAIEYIIHILTTCLLDCLHLDRDLLFLLFFQGQPQHLAHNMYIISIC